MKILIFYLFHCFFLICVDNRIVVDIYHPKKQYDHKSLENIKKPNQTYEVVGLFKYLNSEYYGLMRVGKPSKEFKFIFDTTWADSWLPSSHCSLYELACQRHNRYDSSKSSTYQENGTKIEFNNKEFSLKGFQSIDVFHLSHLKVVNQAFFEMTHMSFIPFFFMEADGVVGLAFHSMASTGALPFFNNMIRQKVIGMPIFTFYMNRDPTTEKAGNLILGGIDRSHAKTNLTYLPVREKKYWTINIDKIIVTKGNKSYTFCNQGCYARMDTSVNTITGPPNDIAEINSLLDARAFTPFWPHKSLVDCRTFASLPHITFVLGGKNFTIESKYYIQHMTYYYAALCLSPFLQSVTDNIWELGGAFLMQFYSEFDMDKSRIGIAETIY